MIIPENELPKYLGKDLESRIDKFRRTIREKLRKLDTLTRNTVNMSLLDYLTVQHQREGRRVINLAEECDLGKVTFIKVLKEYEIPTRTQAEATKAMLEERWQDPEFRVRSAEAKRVELKKRWKDPEFRSRHAEGVKANWKDPEFRSRQAEGVKANWKDPEFRARNAEATRAELKERWQDPEFRSRHAEATWQDPEFRSRHAEGVKAMLEERWKDPKFRSRHSEATRAMRLDKANEGKFYLPTIQGIRKDVGYAKSTWEANLMRIFQHIGRNYRSHEKVSLTISPEYQHLFKDSQSDMEVDFIVTNSQGNISMYEIMAHPLKDQQGAAKLEMLTDQYLSIKVKPISRRFYSRLEKRFKDRINADPRFAGWENRKSNLDNDQKRYGVESLEKS